MYVYNVYNVNNVNNLQHKLNNKYLPMEQPPSLDVDNRLYLVIIVCAYASLQFLIL